MRTLHHSIKPLGKAVNLGVAALVAFGCSSAKPPIKAPLAIEPPANVIRAEWADGRCSFDRSKNTLTYDKDGQSASFKLDQVITDPERLLCADDYSVVLTGKLAVVTLGAQSIFEGREWIGAYGTHSTLANCYYVYVDEMKAEGVKSAGISDGALWFTTAAGNSWVMRFSNPDEWRVSHK